MSSKIEILRTVDNSLKKMSRHFSEETHTHNISQYINALKIIVRVLYLLVIQCNRYQIFLTAYPPFFSLIYTTIFDN